MPLGLFELKRQIKKTDKLLQKKGVIYLFFLTSSVSVVGSALP